MRTPPLALFGDKSLAVVAAEREASALADGSRDADDLIRRFSLDVPVLSGAPRILERQLTVPYLDRFNDELPGGEVLFVVGYPFTGDAALFWAYPEGEKPQSPYASVVPDMVVVKHLAGATTIALDPEALDDVLKRPQPDAKADDPVANERKMNAVAAAMAERISAKLELLRAEAAVANEALATRIRQMVAGG